MDFPFLELIESKGWHIFCEQKAPKFVDVVKELYTNMVGTKDKVVYVRGRWVSFSREQINQAFYHPPIPGLTRLANLNQVRGARPYTGTLYLFFFFLIAELIPVGIQTIFVITKNHLHIQKNYHRSGVHQNLYTYTKSHLLIQTLIHIYV